MGENLFIQLLQISVVVIPVILLLKLLGDRLQRRYVAKWKYYIWLVLALRLLLPWTPNLEISPVQITIPDRELVVFEAPLRNVENAVAEVSQEMPELRESEVVVMPPTLSAEEGPQPQQAEEVNTVKLSAGDVLEIAGGIWLLGVICFLGYHGVVNILAARKVQRWSSPADEELYRQIREALGDDLLPQRLKVLVNTQLASPMVMGLFKPVLYLSELSYQREELRLILRHELTHYRRRDLWYKALLLLVNGVHWFNPFVYLMYQEAERDLECSCDSVVMEDVEKTTRCNYAHLILDTAAGQSINGRLLTSNFHGGAKDMKKRLQNIMDTKKKRHGILTFLILAIISVGAGSLVGFQLGQKEAEKSALQEAIEKTEEALTTDAAMYDVTTYPERLAPGEELVGDKKFESPIDFLDEHLKQNVDKSQEGTYITLGKNDYGWVSAYRREDVSGTFYELEYGNNPYDDIHYEIKDGTLTCELGLYQGQKLYRGKAILNYAYENGEYVIAEDSARLELDWYSDVTARNSLWMHSQSMEEVDGLRLTYNGAFEDRLTLHRAVYGKDAYNVLTVYLENGLIADYKFPSNQPMMNDISHIYRLPMQSEFYDTIILMLQDPYLASTDESTDFYIFHVEMNEEETQAEIVMDAVILDNGEKSANYEQYKDVYLEMPFYHVISDMEAGPYYHEALGETTLRIVGMPYERKAEQYAYVYWDGEAWKTYFE